MRLFGLIGNPLEHSFSKTYFDHKFIAEKLEGCRYELFQLSDVRLIMQLPANFPELEGLNITIPFKRTVIPLLDAMDAIASGIGAVNCIKISRENEKTLLTGYNTDAPAFLKTLLPLLDSRHHKALILGTGGSALAVRHALLQLGIATQFVSRTNDRRCLTYQDLTEEIIQEHLLIINATPQGMFPDVETCPDIPYKHLTSKHLLYDLVYNPGLTEFLRKGKLKGATVKNGLEMLHLQAELSWKIWNKSIKHTD